MDTGNETPVKTHLQAYQRDMQRHREARVAKKIKARKRAAVEEQVRQQKRWTRPVPKKPRGRPIFNPKHPRTAALNLRMSENLRSWYDREAAKAGVPLSEYLYRVMLEHRKRVRHRRHRIRTSSG